MTAENHADVEQRRVLRVLRRVGWWAALPVLIVLEIIDPIRDDPND